MFFNLSRLPFAKQHSTAVAAIVILAIIGHFLSANIQDYLVYQRELISQGQLWRLISGHLLHTNGYHLLLNLAAIIMLWALHGHFYSLKNYAGIFIGSALFCSLALFQFNPDLIQYVGLSGVLHGIFVWGSILDIRYKEKTGYLLFVGVWLKIAYEQIYGASEEVSSLINADVAVDAHLWGAVAGLLLSIVYLGYNKKSQL